MPRFLFQPRWLLTHVLVVAVIVAFVSLGLWQVRRLGERRASNALISSRLSAAPVPLADLLNATASDPRALSYRRVSVSGRYSPADEVLLTPRGNNQEPGHHLLTPLLTGDGRALLVDRGWVPFEFDEAPVAAAAPPGGNVTILGVVVPAQTAARSGGDGRIEFVSAVDIDRLQPQTDADLYPFGLLLQRQRPAAGDLPRAPALPDLSEGSHFSYAVQWFIFAAIAAVGYPLLIRKSMQARSGASRLDR